VQRFFEYDLKNKTVLITGGSRGLGLVMAREFAAEGARLVLCARDEEKLNREGKHALEYAWFSISDALPLLTVSAENAARQIVRACKRGQSELVISIPAKVAVLFHALFPEMTSQLLALGNQLLPSAGGVGTETKKGRESSSVWSPSWLTTLNEQAAVRNNEVLH
jgi:short-subunit dehydrogenase